MARKKTTKTDVEEVESVEVSDHSHEDLEARVAALEEANALLLETVETMKAVVALKDEVQAARDALQGDISGLQTVAKELMAKVSKKMDSNQDGSVDFEEIYQWIQKRRSRRPRG